MDEIKIWAVDGKQASPVEPVDGMRLERDFEDILVDKPELLMPDLRLVGRQMPTGSGPLDLLGVDEDGKLVVFELKRGTLSRDALAQVIDYTSALSSMTEDELSQHIANRSRQPGIQEIENFREWYSETIGDDGLDSLRPMRMFLIGLGVDATTERMVKFLADSSMDISLLTFHGFTHEGKILLARQVRVTGDNRPVDRPGRPRQVNREDRARLLRDRAESYGVADLFSEATDIFRGNWTRLRENPRKVGHGFRLRGLQESGKLARRSYARVDPEDGRVRVVFFGRAVDLCPESFSEPVKDIPFDTWPRGRENDPFASPDTEIQFKLTAQDWEKHKNTVNELSLVVHKALQAQLLGAPSPNSDAFDDDDDDDE